LEIKLQSGFSAQEVIVGVRGMSMAYDADAKRHEMVRISIPKFISAIPALQVQCYPNPFSNSTQIIYELPETGKVDVYVTDYAGKVVRSNSSDYAGPGRYSYDLDATGLKDGVYLVQVVYESQLGMFSRQHLKIVLHR
jgi:hypothetical protein